MATEELDTILTTSDGETVVDALLSGYHTLFELPTSSCSNSGFSRRRWLETPDAIMLPI